MNINMGLADRVVRIILAAGLAFGYFTDRIKGTLGIVLLVVAIVFALTSFVGFCPLYRVLGFSTRKKS
ncbi:MAG: DUF2892 domain-containing protein [Flavobacteriales bacterium]|nr:DUF2892 domain-containing protein [Flavobacteriales bacterium]MCX7767897.1 DUF2892 domain-containing protein [Flavobacteriales bacterium]MDW8409301.1 DUF2892 domain-containing protein [Flavobacteriales bacterium]